MSDRRGATYTRTAGTAERGTGRPMVGPDGRYRIGSVTKSFLAVTVMQLVDEGRIDLGAPVERYLPGLVRGTGEGRSIDGRLIGVHQLVKHTGGLPEFVDVVDWANPPAGPDGYLRLALARPPAASGRFAYANTNYLLLGMIVERVTGKDFRTISEQRILRPLGLTGTYWPAKGERGVRGPHARTYAVHPLFPGPEIDVTDLLPGYEFGASGGLVSTPVDLERFWRALFEGRLVSRRALHDMTHGTVPVVDDPTWPASSRYGYGLGRAPVSCGGTVWMHGGGLPGTTTLSGRTTAGRVVTVYVTGSADTPERNRHLMETMDTALCAR